jgi:demethylmenaquinone methyltransferase / 2-methoxy-6-polyprenyl-1,4-benzoquinol methylase
MAPVLHPRSDDVQKIFGSIAARYDLANSVLSFGIHHYWRRALLRLLPAEPSSSGRSADLVLDVCTGTGDLLPLIKHRFGRVIGVDFSRPMLNVGKKKLGSEYLLAQGDSLQLPFSDQSFGLVTVAFGVRNFEQLEAGLREIRRVLKPNGHLLVLEFGQPRGRIFGALYRFYSKFFMPRIGALLTGNRAAYTYLPATAATFPCREEFTALLERQGFYEARFVALSSGIAYAYCARVGD